MADIIISEINPITTRFNELITDQSYLESIALQGLETAKASAQQTIDQVHKAIGFH